MKSSIFLPTHPIRVRNSELVVVIKKAKADSWNFRGNGSGGTAHRNFNLTRAQLVYISHVFYLTIVYIRFTYLNYKSSEPSRPPERARAT